MTLTRPYNPISYVGNNEQKEFPFNFEEISTDLVKCFITRDDGTRYVPAFVINKEYGTGEEKEYRCVLELNTPLLDTEVITIYRETPQVQDTPFRTLQGYDARALENILSKIVAMIQEINDHNISMDITNGDWTFDVIKENLDKASLIIDFPAKKITTGLYFKVEDGYLYVSQDGEHYIKIADAEDVSDLTRRVEECEVIAGEAKQTAEESKDLSQEAITTANEARVKSQDAIDTSITALNTANQANDKSDRAVADSSQALSVANQANTKSDEAKSTAQEANTKSNQAVATANSADTKANQAISTSQEALSTANSASQLAQQTAQTVTLFDGRITIAENNAEEALHTAESAEEIAKGAQSALSFADYQTFVNEFNSLPADTYKVGQNALIVTVNVPDLWVSGIEATSVPYTYTTDEAIVDTLKDQGYFQVGYYRISQLETGKINLEEYQKKLTAGENITIDENNVISATGGSADATTVIIRSW